MPSTMSSEVSMPRASSIVMTPSLPTLSIASAMIRPIASSWRSEEHTSELQSPCNLVCRLLLEKKKKRCHAEGADVVNRDNGYRGSDVRRHAGRGTGVTVLRSSLASTGHLFVRHT